WGLLCDRFDRLTHGSCGRSETHDGDPADRYDRRRVTHGVAPAQRRGPGSLEVTGDGGSGIIPQSRYSGPSMEREWNDSQPIYRQLRDRGVAVIRDGSVKEGDPPPSVPNVAAEFRVTPFTVLKGYQQLVDEELVEKRR